MSNAFRCNPVTNRYSTQIQKTEVNEESSRPTEPSLQTVVSLRLYALLVQEQAARRELLPLVNDLIERRIPEEMREFTIEQVLLAVRDYMSQLASLSDGFAKG